MRGLSLLILLTFLVQASAKDMITNQTANAHEFMGKVFNAWSDKLVEKLADRGLNAGPLPDADLDKTTFAKTHPDSSYGTPHKMRLANIHLLHPSMPMRTAFHTTAAVQMQTLGYRATAAMPKRIAYPTIAKAEAKDSVIEQRLSKLGLTIPDAPTPAGNYIPWKRSGNVVYIAGQIPKKADGSLMTGMSGSADYSISEAQEAAKVCGINLIAQMKQACGGDLSKVRSILKIEGFVQCTADFTEHPKVLNGVSDLMVDVFGPEIGAHARFAVGCSSLPLAIAVEVGAIVETDLP